MFSKMTDLFSTSSTKVLSRRRLSGMSGSETQGSLRTSVRGKVLSRRRLFGKSGSETQGSLCISMWSHESAAPSTPLSRDERKAPRKRLASQSAPLGAIRGGGLFLLMLLLGLPCVLARRETCTGCKGAMDTTDPGAKNVGMAWWCSNCTPSSTSGGAMGLMGDNPALEIPEMGGGACALDSCRMPSEGHSVAASEFAGGPLFSMHLCNMHGPPWYAYFRKYALVSGSAGPAQGDILRDPELYAKCSNGIQQKTVFWWNKFKASYKGDRRRLTSSSRHAPSPALRLLESETTIRTR